MRAGGIAGHFCFSNRDSTSPKYVTNNHFEGNIDCRSSTNCYVGGIIGSASYSWMGKSYLYIEDCNSSGKINSYSNYRNAISGGIVAYIYNSCGSSGATYKPNVIIKNSSSSSSIDSKVDLCVYSRSVAGGILGYCVSNSPDAISTINTYLDIVHCYSEGSINALCDAWNNGSEYVLAGGIVGYAEPYWYYGFSITDCFSKGDISIKYGFKGYNELLYAGGLVGYSTNSLLITGDCYYCGCKSAGKYGIRKGSSTPICYYNPIGDNGTIVKLTSVKNYEVGTTTDISNNLVATVTPHLSDKSGITWESSDPDIVQITDTGYIDGTNSDSLLCNINCKAVGTSTITVTTADGASASCLVTVNEVDNTLKIKKISLFGIDGLESYDFESTQTFDVDVVFNKDIELGDNTNLNLYTYVNDEKVKIGTSHCFNKKNSNTVTLEVVSCVMPKGKICIEFPTDSVKPVSNDVDFDLDNINSNYFENNSNFILGLNSFRFSNFKDYFEEKYTFSEDLVSKLIKAGISKNEINKTKKKKMGWGLLWYICFCCNGRKRYYRYIRF